MFGIFQVYQGFLQNFYRFDFSFFSLSFKLSGFYPENNTLEIMLASIPAIVTNYR